MYFDTEQFLENLFELYFQCRKNKRYSFGALTFEVDFENNLMQLYRELQTKTWHPGSCNCFIVDKPVKREIFAAPFKDRIVHHILISELEPCFEKYFIHDSYACRKGKGTHMAIKRLFHFINSQTCNNSQEAWILKMDIKGFFMNIERKKLYEKLELFIETKYRQSLLEKLETDKNKKFKGQWILDLKEIEEKLSFVKYLTREIVFNDPTCSVNYKSPKRAWEGLPKDKSLFTTKTGYGLPIGNLTSQVFANFYLTEFDHYIKHDLGIKCYLRYVDDFVIVHNDEGYLKYLIPRIREFLKEELGLTLHPKKIYLQPAKIGVPFLGAYIKPNYIMPGKRVLKNFMQKARGYEKLAQNHKPSKEELNEIQASINSYLGIMRHYKSWRFRVKVLKEYFKEKLSKHYRIEKSAIKIEKKK